MTVVVGATADASSGGPPIELLWAGQVITLAVAVVTGWFALRTKRVDADETRRARFDARFDKEFDDRVAENERLREKYDKEYALRLRYERLLIRAGIDPETGRRFPDDAAP